MRKTLFILGLFVASLAYGQLDTVVVVGSGSHNRGGDSKRVTQEKTTAVINRVNTITTEDSTIDVATADIAFLTVDTVDIGVVVADSILTDAIHYGNTYWDDLRTPSNLSKKVPGKEAGDQAYKGGVVISFADGSDQAVSFNVQLPHGYKLGTDLEFHIHIVLPTAGAGAGAENIAFDFTHSWANIMSEFPTETNVSDTTDVQNYPADTHRLVEIAGTIDGSAITGVSSMLICSLTRDVSVASNYTDDVYLIELDFHYQLDAPGSWTEYDK